MLKFIGKLHKKAKENQKGFTLIELMIVVVIIGILAAITVPNFIASSNKAKAGAEKANRKILQSAADRVYAETGKKVTDLNTLVDEYVDSVPKRADGSPFTIIDGVVRE